MGSHLIDGEFKSDKYDWCPPGFLALKLSDRFAQPLIWQYANQREIDDKELAQDLKAALALKGYHRKH